MSARRLRQEIDNINATIAMAARELASKHEVLTEEQRNAFWERIKTLDERGKAVSIAMAVLEKKL